MSKDTFDAVPASVPMNGTAGAVTGRGEHYEPEINTSHHWIAPPLMKALPKDPSCPDLRGQKVGRLTVLGLGDTKRGRGSAGGSWVVRCVCGQYEYRSAKAIRNPKNVEDCCQRCYRWRVTRKRFEREGGRPIEDFTR